MRARLIGQASEMSLHFGSPQIAIGIVLAVLATLFASAFVIVARQAGTEVGEQRVHDVGYWIRQRWIALLAGSGVVVLGLSFFTLPYARGSDTRHTVVKVTAGQFFWTIAPNSVPAGARVRFDVTSID